MSTQEEILKLGGNSFKESIGKWIENFGKKISEKGNSIQESAKPLIITNPICRVVNPFTLIISFTVNPSEKYQIVLEGDYKSIYRESDDKQVDMNNNEVFHIISTNRDKWFKKE